MIWVYIILGSIISCFWLVTYVNYRLMLYSAIILRSAGRMKTGNDLNEQVEKTKKEKMPNYFQFYWSLIKEYKR